MADKKANVSSVTVKQGDYRIPVDIGPRLESFLGSMGALVYKAQAQPMIRVWHANSCSTVILSEYVAGQLIFDDNGLAQFGIQYYTYQITVAGSRAKATTLFGELERIIQRNKGKRVTEKMKYEGGYAATLRGL